MTIELLTEGDIYQWQGETLVYLGERHSLANDSTLYQFQNTKRLLLLFADKVANEISNYS